MRASKWILSHDSNLVKEKNYLSLLVSFNILIDSAYGNTDESQVGF